MKTVNWFRLIFLQIFIMGVLFVVLGSLEPEDGELNTLSAMRLLHFYSGIVLALVAAYVLFCSLWWQEPGEKSKEGS